MSGDMRYEFINDLKEIDVFVDLINRAYRGDEGEGRWTTEKHLIQGERISAKDLGEVIESDDSVFIAGYIDGCVVACICLEISESYIEFGKYAVSPVIQGKGYGKNLLGYAEDIAKRFGRDYQVSVVSQNLDLMEFYKKRGYKVFKSGVPYPVNMGVGSPKINDIALTIMRKCITNKPKSAFHTQSE